MAAINFPPRTQGVPDLTLVTLGDLSTEYYWTGEQWLSVGLGGGGASVTIQSTPPSSPSAGDLWFDNDSGILSMYYDSTWVDVGGGDSGTSAGSVNGIVQCDGNGNFSAAVAGTDYALPGSESGAPQLGQGYPNKHSLASAAGTNATVVKASQAVLGGVYLSCASYNTGVCIKIYDKASTPTIGVDTPVLRFYTYSNVGGAGEETSPGQAVFVPAGGINFASGISYVLTREITDSGGTGVSAGEVVVSMVYV